MRRIVLLAAGVVLLALPGTAAAGRFAVGVDSGVSLAQVAKLVRKETGGAVSSKLAPIAALILDAPSARGVSELPGVSYVERLEPTRRLAFTATDPYVDRQWYLTQTHAFDFWPQPPNLPAVRVAVIDSGIDGDHPDLAHKIALAASFVGGSPRTDQQGHGTFIAGEIAAELDNGLGIAGIAFPAELLIAKVLRADGTISLEAEARAIRWAVARHARVINLSLGGVRDPLDRRRDTYSPLEESAIEYAYSKGVVVVAAVGNGDQAPASPWPYASYPAALPHVVGVSALGKDGSVPSFSNRDAVYNDIAAPGQDIFSTFPYSLTSQQPSCLEQGYSTCANAEYRHAEGTSFSAPQVSAAAGLLFSAMPTLTNDQVVQLLERTAVDANPASGCRRCPYDRDSLTGWGKLNIADALRAAEERPLPLADAREANDEAGGHAARIWGSRGKLTATIDYWDDQIDVYRLRLRHGQHLSASVRGPDGTDTNLVLWKPGTKRVEGFSVRPGLRAKLSARPGSFEQIRYSTRRGGWYYLEVKISAPGSGPYTLRFAKT